VLFARFQVVVPQFQQYIAGFYLVTDFYGQVSNLPTDRRGNAGPLASFHRACTGIGGGVLDRATRNRGDNHRNRFWACEVHHGRGGDSDEQKQKAKQFQAAAGHGVISLINNGIRYTKSGRVDLLRDSGSNSST